ncbi:DUF551 domain-containing protein [Klebsiella pneumoniae]
MTSKLTREERVQALYDLKVGQVLSQADIENVKMLSRMALAAMDSEPVAWRWRSGPDTRWHLASSGDLAGEVEPLYRHAQPALVIPDEISLEKVAEMTAARGAEYSIRDGIIAAKWWNACRAAMLAAAQQPQNAPQNIPEIIPGWIPVSERMPEPGILVLVYTPPQPGDYPGDVRIGFDYIDPDGDDPTYWFDHGEIYEHFCCVACNGMTGPSEKAPYTHWMPLPAAPQEVNNG